MAGNLCAGRNLCAKQSGGVRLVSAVLCRNVQESAHVPSGMFLDFNLQDLAGRISSGLADQLVCQISIPVATVWHEKRTAVVTTLEAAGMHLLSCFFKARHSNFVDTFHENASKRVLLTEGDEYTG
jgi:hypothetical protein